ncbi:MAG: signal peptidase II [Pseudomonadota bacterium]|nr:signal peptidase II [Pseudomonadota bacterium]
MNTNLWKALSLLALVFVLASSVVLDQLSKRAAEKELLLWEHPENTRQYQGKPHFIWSTAKSAPDRDSSKFYLYLGFNYVRNQGAAWGMLSDMRDSLRVPFFYIMTAIAVLLILYYLYTTPFDHRLARFALVLILSGAIGNFIDRWRGGYVIDWIDVRWNIGGWFYHFPNFNVADACISVGVFCLLLDASLLEYLRRRRIRNMNNATALPA